MRPADDFVADFVGADRALKRLASWRAARWTSSRSSDGARRPPARRRADAGAHRAQRDARGDTEEALVVRDGGEPLGRLTRRRDRPAARGRADRGAREPVSAAAAWVLLAQSSGGFFRDRSHDDSCVANNGICPGWAWDNFDRYTHPFVQHLELVAHLDRRRLRHRVGARARRPPAPVARRAGHAGQRDPLHDPEPGGLLPAAAAHRARHDDRRDRAVLLHAAHPLPQHAGRPRRRPGGRPRRRPRDGLHRPPAALARRGAARAARDPRRPAHRADDDRRPGALAFFAGAGGLGEPLASQKDFKTNVVWPAGCASCWRRRSTASCSLLQRLVTPWTRSRPA